MESTGLRTRYGYSRHLRQTEQALDGGRGCLSVFVANVPTVMASRLTQTRIQFSDNRTVRRFVVLIETLVVHIYIQVYVGQRTDNKSQGRAAAVKSFSSRPNSSPPTSSSEHHLPQQGAAAQPKWIPPSGQGQPLQCPNPGRQSAAPPPS